MKMNIVDFAYQVIEMRQRICDLEIENNRLRQYEHDYYELLNSSLAHNQTMMSNTLKLILTPGVVQACKDNATFEEA